MVYLSLRETLRGLKADRLMEMFLSIWLAFTAQEKKKKPLPLLRHSQPQGLEQHSGRQKKKQKKQDGVGECEVVTFHGELSSVSKDGRAEQRWAINYHSLTGEMRLRVSKTRGQFSQGQFSLY